MDEKTKAIMQLSDEVLEICDNQNEFTRSDLQGAIEALTAKIYNAGYDRAILDKIPY